MCAEALAHRWAALLLGATLLTTGCVTLAPQPASQIPHALSTFPLHTPPLASVEGEREQPFSAEAGVQERLHRRLSARGLGFDVALASAGELPPRGAASSGVAAQGPPGCGNQAVPPDWPDFSSEGGKALLAPFLACTSPGEFVALQERVDMPRLVEALDGWHAVWLGALGPVREDAVPQLQRKRAAFLLSATERYGRFHAEVFALFVLHSAHDDEVDELLRLLARDKQLGQTLALMPAVRELEARGLPLSRYPDRAEQAGDVLRGLSRAARDALSSSPASDGTRYMEMSGRWEQLPPPYQKAAHEVDRALALRHLSAGSVAAGTFDAMTFGVPLGFYYLVAGTGHGAYSLSQGQHEQAARELAPAVLMGALYAGGKGLRALSEARGAPGAGLGGLGLPELRLTALKEMVRQLEVRLGVDGLRQLARDIQASREAGRFVAVGGVDAALALREAEGNVAKAQAMMMSQAKPEARAPSAVKSPTPRRAGAAEPLRGLASLVDQQAGLTREVVEAKLAVVELESAGPRLPKDVTVLEKQRPSLDAPPPVAEGSPRWSEYVAYREKRLGELKEGQGAKGPLRWEAYERMWGWFTRGLDFERLIVKLLQADAELPRAQRHFLGDFDKPRIETYVGVKKPGTGLRFADVLIIEEGELAGRPRRVETLSFKSRDLSGLEPKALKAQMLEDAKEALRKYGETLDIRRDSLQHLLPEGSEVSVQRVRLIYEGGNLMPRKVKDLNEAMETTREKVPGVEVSFQ